MVKAVLAWRHWFLNHSNSSQSVWVSGTSPGPSCKVLCLLSPSPSSWHTWVNQACGSPSSCSVPAGAWAPLLRTSPVHPCPGQSELCTKLVIIVYLIEEFVQYILFSEFSRNDLLISEFNAVVVLFGCTHSVPTFAVLMHFGGIQSPHMRRDHYISHIVILFFPTWLWSQKGLLSMSGIWLPSYEILMWPVSSTPFHLQVSWSPT